MSPDPAEMAATAAAEANMKYVAKRGHEDPAYLRGLLPAARRQEQAARQVAADLWKRYVAALRAEWEGYTDGEIMASDHLRRALNTLANDGTGDSYWYNRLHRLLPKNYMGLQASEPLTLAGSDERERWEPSFSMHLYATAAKDHAPDALARTVVGIRELGRLWRFERRLIRLECLTEDLGQISQKVWIEFEAETDRARLLHADNRRGDDPQQIIYGDLAEVLSAAIEHVQLVGRGWE